MLQLTQIDMDFGENTKILKGLVLEVSQGQKVAIVGKSGSGKSTLLSLVSGLSTPTKGRVMIGGVDLSSKNEDERALYRRHNISIIFQDYKLIDHLTVYENVALALELKNVSKNEVKNKTLSILEKVGLSHRLNSYPETLSGGEKQRCAMARALVVDSQIMLADEPNANLDIETGSAVMNLMFDLVFEFNKTFLLVTHDLDLARRCDVIYLLNNGILSEYVS